MKTTENNIDINMDELMEAFTTSIEAAFNNLDFPLECLDWLSYNPDFHIEQHYKKVA